MKKITESQREIGVLQEAEVIVVGGGPAGIGAALASARTGASTILIDRFGSLGGLQTQGNNPFFSFVDPELHGGIIQDVLGRLTKGGALKNLDDMPVREKYRFKQRLLDRFGADKLPKRLVETNVGYWGLWGIAFDIEYYKFLLDNMMQEAGVGLLYQAFAAGAIREGNHLKGVIIESKEGRHAILGKTVIDTTGDGSIIWKSGAPCGGEEGFPVGPHKGSQGKSLNAFFMAGVDLKKFRAFREANPDEWGEMYTGKKIIAEAVKKGAHIVGDTVVLSTQQDTYNTGRLYCMNAIHWISEGKTSWSIEEGTNCEIDLRKQMWAVFKVLKENVPGFENAFIEKTPAISTVGNPHRLIGDYVMTVGDMRAGRTFDDSVAINNMPPDLYEPVGRFAYEILPHDIPLRALVSKEVDNLLAAGTTMSSGFFALKGLKYCTPSICTGQAAGTAAALAAKNNVSPKKLDIKLLQKTLRDQGARVTVKDVSEEALEPYRAIKKMGLVFKRIPEPYDATEEEIERN